MRRRVIEEALHVAMPNDDLKLSEQLFWSFGGDPVKYLRVYFDISRHPLRNTLLFDIEMLDWMRRAWEAAAVACPHADDVKHEAERFKHLRKRLADEMAEGKPVDHICLNHPKDWPQPRTVLRAMFGLLHAEQRTLQ